MGHPVAAQSQGDHVSGQRVCGSSPCKLQASAHDPADPIQKRYSHPQQPSLTLVTTVASLALPLSASPSLCSLFPVSHCKFIHCRTLDFFFAALHVNEYSLQQNIGLVSDTL